MTDKNIYIGQHDVWDGKTLPTDTVLTILSRIDVLLKKIAKRKARMDAKHHLPMRLRRSTARVHRSKTSPALFSAYYRARRSNAVP